MSRDTPLIVARDLTKRFKNFTAVDGVSFAVHPAESFGFLGPNGAGKTSTMRVDRYQVSGFRGGPGIRMQLKPQALIPRIIIELLPLYHGTAMLRQLTTGAMDRTFVVHVGYRVILGATAFAVAMRRLERALIK